MSSDIQTTEKGIFLVIIVITLIYFLTNVSKLDITGNLKQKIGLVYIGITEFSVQLYIKHKNMIVTFYYY